MTTEKLFQPLTFDAANAEQTAILEGIQKGMGFVPNLMATMTHSPTLMNGYLALSAAFDKGSFNPVERHLILLAVSDLNDCRYCRAAHSTILKSMLKADEEAVNAVKIGGVPSDAKLAALVLTAREMAGNRGAVSASTQAAFFGAGYSGDQLLEILVGIGLKSMSNYLDGFNSVDIDPAFQAEA